MQVNRIGPTERNGTRAGCVACFSLDIFDENWSGTMDYRALIFVFFV